MEVFEINGGPWSMRVVERLLRKAIRLDFCLLLFQPSGVANPILTEEVW